MFELNITLAILFPDSDVEETAAALTETGVAAVEYFDWQTGPADAAVETFCDGDLDVAATGFPMAYPAPTDPDHRDAAVDALERSVDGTVEVRGSKDPGK
jgi:sugar phosphate isomerase/epimerase